MIDTVPVNYPEMIVEKSNGLTSSERKLAALGYHTFLRLWSYPNPYKFQSKGKELCDLLIIFENHIIIFSDKDCIYGCSGDNQVDWRRWYKKAIRKSADQLVGAKSWITRYPDKIAIDASCSRLLPLKIEITSETKFHLIAIAHGATVECQKYFSTRTGGLFIDNQIVGEMHTNADCKPFCVGRILEDSENFIHVFDEDSYANVLSELDTIQDFLRYLDARRKLFLTKKVLAESENNILAQHLKGVIRNNPIALEKACQAYSGIYLRGYMLDEVRQSSQYFDWKRAIKASYFWDMLLQRTFFFIENGQSSMTTSPTIQEQSQLFKRMAREDRAHRRCLSEGFLSFLATARPEDKGSRMLYSPDEPDTCYLLLLLPRKGELPDKDYRKMRLQMLEDHCNIIKADNPQISHIVGVALESAKSDYSSEDFLYLDASEWSAEQQANALFIKKAYEDVNLLAERQISQRTYFAERLKMKGRDRNKLCPCGSGKKLKRCCGKA